MGKNFNTLGAMLDCSRNAVMNVSEAKRFIGLLAKMGYNQFQLYIEDIYEIEGEKYFGYRRGRYSPKELSEIADFGDSLGVEVVPCIQTLAHLGIFRWKDYAPLRDCADIFLVGEPKVYELIEKMFKTLRNCFKTDKIHIGMDEAHSLGHGKYKEINGERDRIDIIFEHLEKVSALAEKYGFKPMMWSDMFYRIYNKGTYYVEGAEFPKELKQRFPENVSIVYWDYYHLEKEFYDDMIKSHKQLSDKVIFAGGGWKWTGFVPHNQLSVPGTKAALVACMENGIKDVLITMWGDNGAECSPYCVLPTLCVAACYNQGIFDEEQIKQKFKEWTGAEYDDFMLLDLPDYVEDVKPDYVINPSKYQLYNDCLSGLYDNGGVYEGDGENYAEISKKIKQIIDRAGEFSYLFDTMAALCDVLEIKAEIGIRARKAYKTKDIDGLKQIVADYSEMIDRTEEFYNLFRKQWFKENKSYGFEMQDIRLGGLIMRMKNCCNIIEEYLAGESDVIYELEEDSLPMIEKKEIAYTWRECIGVNGL